MSKEFKGVQYGYELEPLIILFYHALLKHIQLFISGLFAT